MNIINNCISFHCIMTCIQNQTWIYNLYFFSINAHNNYTEKPINNTFVLINNKRIHYYNFKKIIFS